MGHLKKFPHLSRLREPKL